MSIENKLRLCEQSLIVLTLNDILRIQIGIRF